MQKEVKVTEQTWELSRKKPITQEFWVREHNFWCRKNLSYLKPDKTEVVLEEPDMWNSNRFKNLSSILQTLESQLDEARYGLNDTPEKIWIFVENDCVF